MFVHSLYFHTFDNDWVHPIYCTYNNTSIKRPISRVVVCAKWFLTTGWSNSICNDCTGKMHVQQFCDNFPDVSVKDFYCTAFGCIPLIIWMNQKKFVMQLDYFTLQRHVCLNPIGVLILVIDLYKITLICEAFSSLYDRTDIDLTNALYGILCWRMWHSVSC